jgi:hypothetical protein
MAYTSGTATDYKDLLAIMATFAAANGWVILEQSATKIYLKGTGLAGLDEIYCGVETYEDPPNNRYNWNMVGSWGYRAGRELYAHPVTSCPSGTLTDQVVAYFWNSPIPYWMVATPRRIIVSAKVGTTYQMVWLGLVNPPATDAQYPYPLYIAGSGNSLLKNSSDYIQSFWNNGSYAGKLSFPGGAWGFTNGTTDYARTPQAVIQTFNEGNKLTMLTGLDGSYLLEPLYVRPATNYGILGELDGLYRVTGYNNTAENIITVAGVNYMVFPDGSRSGYGDYCAMRLN